MGGGARALGMCILGLLSLSCSGEWGQGRAREADSCQDCCVLSRQESSKRPSCTQRQSGGWPRRSASGAWGGGARIPFLPVLGSSLEAAEASRGQLECPHQIRPGPLHPQLLVSAPPSPAPAVFDSQIAPIPSLALCLRASLCTPGGILMRGHAWVPEPGRGAP